MSDKCTIEGCNRSKRNKGYGKKGKLCPIHHCLKYPKIRESRRKEKRQYHRKRI